MTVFRQTCIVYFSYFAWGFFQYLYKFYENQTKPINLKGQLTNVKIMELTDIKISACICRHTIFKNLMESIRKIAIH